MSRKRTEESVSDILEAVEDDIDSIFDEEVEETSDVADVDVVKEDEQISDIISEVETEVEEPKTIIQDVTIPFSDVDTVLIEEKDHDGHHMQSYVYERIKDPNGNTHPRFTGFCLDKTKDGDVWYSLNGLLSSRYTAVSMTKVIENFIKTVPIIGQPEYVKKPFSMVAKMHLDTDVVYFDKEECKYFLSLVSGVSLDDLDEFKSTACLMISNSYDGSASVSVSTPIHTISKTSGNIYDFTDYFTMMDKGSNISHIVYNSGNINSELGNIEERLVRSKTRLENVKDIDKHVDNISKKLLKAEQKRRFLSLCENLDGEFKNLFYVFMMVSIILSKEFDIHSHSSISNYVSSIK